MAFSSSFFLSDTVVDIFNNAIAVNVSSTDTWKIALFNNTIVPSPDTVDAAFGVAPWNANEVFGTGWATGGVALSAFAVTLTAGVGVKFDADDVSVASTSLTNAHGCLIYDSSISNRALIAVTFGADYSTNNGTFGIAWDAAGIATIDLTP